MNTVFRDLVLSRVTGAVAHARALAAVPHAGLKGQLREAVVRDLIRPFLPLTIGIGQGQIVAHDGQTSSQMDIILYDRRVLPSVLFEDQDGLFPVETVLATVEVKSVLNATALREAHEAADRLSRFPYLSGIRDRYTGANFEHPIEHLVFTLLALSTDLNSTGKSELERVRDLGYLTPAGLRALCVVDRGCWLAIGRDWYKVPMQIQYAEVVGFLSAVTSSLIHVANTRGWPDINQYLFDQHELPVLGRDVLPGFTT